MQYWLYIVEEREQLFFFNIFVPSLSLSQSLLFLSVSRIEVRANKVDILVWSERQIRVMSKHMLEGRYMRLIIKFDAVRKRTISSIRIITVIVLSLEQNACRYILWVILRILKIILYSLYKLLIMLQPITFKCHISLWSLSGKMCTNIFGIFHSILFPDSEIN